MKELIDHMKFLRRQEKIGFKIHVEGLALVGGRLPFVI